MTSMMKEDMLRSGYVQNERGLWRGPPAWDERTPGIHPFVREALLLKFGRGADDVRVRASEERFEIVISRNFRIDLLRVARSDLSVTRSRIIYEYEDLNRALRVLTEELTPVESTGAPSASDPRGMYLHARDLTALSAASAGFVDLS